MTRLRDSRSEEQLAAVVVQWLRLRDWEIYQEVESYGGRCDIVATRGPLVWIIETKIAFGTAVLEQARHHLTSAHLVSVATGYSRTQPAVLTDWCQWKGVGWITVGGMPLESVDERIEPTLRRRVDRDIRKRLREEHKTACAAGSAKGGYWTPFKDTCRKVREVVVRRPGVTLKELLAEITHHYSSGAAARAGIAHWAEKGKIPGVELKREGRALRLFPASEAA